MLTSRERLILTLNHHNPGDIVIDIGAVSTIGALCQMPDEIIRKRIGIDVVEVVINTMVHNYRNEKMCAKILHFPQGNRMNFGDDASIWNDKQLKIIETRIAQYDEETDYGILGSVAFTFQSDMAYTGGPLMKLPRRLRSPADWLTTHHKVPEHIRENYELQLEVVIKNVKLLKQAVGEKIQAIFISGTDLGSQRARFITNDMYRDFYFPYHKKINDWIHQHTSWKTFFHTSGTTVNLLPDLYKAGIDVLNPAQCLADGEDLTVWINKWKDKFVFWGSGLENQNLMTVGTPKEAYRQALKRLNIYAPGGGFVLKTGHNIGGQISADNFMAVMNAVMDYNKRIIYK